MSRCIEPRSKLVFQPAMLGNTRGYVEFLGGGQLIFLIHFHPKPWEKNQFLTHIVQMGWFNHQLDFLWGETDLFFWGSSKLAPGIL